MGAVEYGYSILRLLHEYRGCLAFVSNFSYIEYLVSNLGSMAFTSNFFQYNVSNLGSMGFTSNSPVSNSPVSISPVSNSPVSNSPVSNSPVSNPLVPWTF